MTTLKRSRGAAFLLAATTVAAAANAQLPPGPGGPPTVPPGGGPLTPPLKVTPIAPGSVQRAPPRVLPTPPAVWTFAELKVEAVDPTRIRLAWQGREGATHYRVYRDDAFVTEVAAGSPLSFLDETRTPGQSAAYFVEALQQPSGPTRVGPVTPAPGSAGTLKNTVVLQPGPVVLERSQKKTGITPSLEAPRDLSVTLTDAKKRIVRIAWSLPKWVTGVELLRDGAALVRTTSAAATFIDDAPPMAGTHVYAVRTLYTAGPAKNIFRSADSPSLSLRTSPFRMVAIGDSIMWGQGLADSAKFTTLTRDGIRTALNVEVELTSFAHSGAILRGTTGALPGIGQQESLGFDQNALVTPGEIPNSFPTIFHQLNVQGAAPAVKRNEVDLVLVDGCINDVGVMSILNPKSTPSAIRAMAQTKCAPMTEVLTRIHALYPAARIVVTGYYPIVSQLSDLTALPVLVASAVGTAALVTPLLGIPPDPVAAVVAIAAAIGGTSALRTKLSESSEAFYSASSAALTNAAATASTQAGVPSMATFAPLPYEPKNAYAAPSSWLWLVPTGAVANDQDDVITARTASCHQAGVLDRSVGRPVIPGAAAPSGLDMLKCERASMGHPNHPGAQAYATAIAKAIQPNMATWRERFATVRRAP